MFLEKNPSLLNALFQLPPSGLTSLNTELVVGTQVLAIHPQTKDLLNGSILTTSEKQYYVQFDRQDMGVHRGKSRSTLANFSASYLYWISVADTDTMPHDALVPHVGVNGAAV
jgi:hypothetical protein